MPKLPPRTPRAAHELVASVARGICEELYEQLMRNDTIRKVWLAKWPEVTEKRRVEEFVKLYLPSALAPARATLATMLRGPYEDDLKQPVADALILDASLAPGAHH